MNEQIRAPRSEAFDVFVVGLGTVGVSQLTREVEQAIGRSREVLYLDHGLGVAEHLAGLCPKTTDLAHCYRPEEDRLRAYDRMTALVLEAALDHPPVTLAFYGHPRVFVYPTQQLLAAAAHLELSVRVLPGISSIDAMLVDLGLDPGFQGLQIHEATDLILRRRPLHNDVPCLLLQPGAVETALTTPPTSTPRRFARLVEHLRQFYPSDHVIAFVVTSTFRLARSDVVAMRLDELTARAEEVALDATLYLPPVELRPVADEGLLNELRSVEHLRDIAR